MIGSVALLALFVGCATSPTKRTENLLGNSGFKAVTATTPAQQQQMKTLPPDRISAVKRKGKTYYVFPDHPRNLLYVGTPAQYQAYRQLLMDQHLAQDGRLEVQASEQQRTDQDLGLAGGDALGWEQEWGAWDSD
jgi:hypothetical protein